MTSLSQFEKQKLEVISRHVHRNRSQKPFRKMTDVEAMVSQWKKLVTDNVITGKDAGGYDDYCYLAYFRREIEELGRALPEKQRNILMNVVEPYDRLFFENTDSIPGTIANRPETEWWYARIPRKFARGTAESFLSFLRPFPQQGAPIELRPGRIDMDALAKIETFGRSLPQFGNVSHLLARWVMFAEVVSYAFDGEFDEFQNWIQSRVKLEALTNRLPGELKFPLERTLQAADEQFIANTVAVPNVVSPYSENNWSQRIPKQQDPYTRDEYLEILQRPSTFVRCWRWVVRFFRFR